MESGCLPIMFDTDDVGCQADPPQEDSDCDSDNTSLDSDEEWCLEQIELAYKKINLKSQLAEYEKRQGLKEVISVYSTMCSELEIDREDSNFDNKTTTESLLSYKPLMDKTLKLKISRESDVALLCTQIAEIWKNIGCEPTNSYYTEIMRVTKCKPRRSTLGTTSMLPRKSSSGGPPLLTPTLTTITSLTECHSRLVEELEKAESYQFGSPIDSFMPDTTEPKPPATHNDCLLIWASIEEKVKQLHLKGSSWEQKMKGIVSMAEEEPDVGMGILEVGLENITKAQDIHAEITLGLKTLSQDVALLDCHRQLSSSRFPSRVSRPRDDITNIRNKVTNLIPSLISGIDDFTSVTHGVPYVGPPIFSELLGLPTEADELLTYLRNIQVPTPKTVKYSDVNASI
eukprot:TRINITY_DN30513_c0_g1_i1.p1 TRINITY_DN30513_c0_g1~~TRINITY_DN30513_c0_g1_i1.p1  ORF type:complete len:400 (+),score=64.41 TRINITY_DN30513_c0_g1_i1:66-1265(+)